MLMRKEEVCKSLASCVSLFCDPGLSLVGDACAMTRGGLTNYHLPSHLACKQYQELSP